MTTKNRIDEMITHFEKLISEIEEELHSLTDDARLLHAATKRSRASEHDHWLNETCTACETLWDELLLRFTGELEGELRVNKGYLRLLKAIKDGE